MAISKQAGMEEDSLLNVTAQAYYFNTMRPYLEQMYMTCVTDEELCRTIQKVMNSGDTACVRKEYDKLAEAFDVIEVAITDKNYFNGVMQKASEKEKEMVRNLPEKIESLRAIIKCEPKDDVAPEGIKDRIGYRPGTVSSPIGENEDFATHNMSALNKPMPKERIPNIN